MTISISIYIETKSHEHFKGIVRRKKYRRRTSYNKIEFSSFYELTLILSDRF